MALPCLIRGIPKSMQACIKQYVSGQHLQKFQVGQRALHNQLSYVRPIVASQNLITSTKFSCINYTQNKNFSTSSIRCSSSGHDHSKLWTAERILATSMLGIVPAAFIFPSAILDALMAVTFVMHNHWGIEAIVVDYVRPIIFGPVIPKLALGAVYLLSIVVLVGLLKLTFLGAGLVNTISMFWKL